MVPAVYVVYMYDVNQWEDQPLGVVLGAIGAAAALGVGFTFLWHAGLLGDDLSPVDFDGNGAGGHPVDRASWCWCCWCRSSSEVLKQVGPILLARRPAFDDMIDGLTFGVAAGAAFAAAETIVVNRGLFSTFGHVDSPNAGFWVSLILSAAVVKPIVYGAATGIAVASFSGLGAGYDGFKPAYFRGLAEALVANILFQGGLFFAARIEGTTGAVVGLVWGALIAAVLWSSGCATCCTSPSSRRRWRRPPPASPSRTPRAGRRTAPRARCRCWPARTSASPAAPSVRAGSKVTRARNRTDDDRHRRRRSRRSRRPRPGSRRRTTRGPPWWSVPWWRRSWSAVWSARSRRPPPPTRATT